MNYFQNGYYELVMPITDSGGQPIASLAKATLTLYRGGVAEVDLSLGAGLTFSDSEVVATLADTSGLVGAYDYELWVETDDGKKHLMLKDRLHFQPTRKRI